MKNKLRHLSDVIKISCSFTRAVGTLHFLLSKISCSIYGCLI